MQGNKKEIVTWIRPQQGWRFVNFKEVMRFKDLLYFLTLRGIKAKYAQSVLGIGWAILQPLFTTVVFTIVFGRLAKVSSDGIPYALFSYLGLWPWNYFSGTLTDSSNSLITNANLITKVYFPRIILPLASIFSRFLDFIIAFLIVIIFLTYYKVMPGFGVFFLPILITQLLLTSIGLGMILSSMAVQYRDIKYALQFAVQLLMYAAPVVYSTTAVPDKYRFWYSLNPMVGVIEGFRAAFLSRTMPWELIWPGTVVCMIIFLLGLLYFRKMEGLFADVA